MSFYIDQNECLGCGACMERCPQNIEIPTLLKELTAVSAKNQRR